MDNVSVFPEPEAEISEQLLIIEKDHELLSIFFLFLLPSIFGKNPVMMPIRGRNAVT